MKPRTSVLLAILAVAALIGGWFIGPASTLTAGGAIARGGLAFPGLVGRLSQASAITIEQKGNTLRLDRTGDGWSVANDGGYPAKPDQVHALLAGMAELRLDAPRTTQRSEFAVLGVADPGKKNDSALVSVLDSAGKPLAALIVGHDRTGANGDAHQLYVRRPGTDQSWLAEGQLNPDSDAKDWMNRAVLNVNHVRIASITADVKSTGGSAHIVLTRQGDTFTLTDPANGPKLDPTMLSDVTHALDNLDFTAVQPAAKMPGTPAGQTVYVTKDGLTVTATLNQDGGALWAHFVAAGTGKAEEEAAEMNKHLAPWAFQLAAYKTKPMLPALANLKAAPAPPGAASASAMPPPGTLPAP